MAREMEVAVARGTASATGKRRGVWRRHRGSNTSGRRSSGRAGWIPFVYNPVSKAGNRAVEALKKAVSAIATSPVTAARIAANIAKASTARTVLWRERLVQRGASLSNLLLVSQNRLFERFKTMLPYFLKIEWKRYAWATCLLILVLAESVYFRGANISLLLDSRLLSNPSLNDSVDAMFARFNQERLNTVGNDFREQQFASATEPKSPRRKALVDQPSSPATVRTPPTEPLARSPSTRRDRSLIASSSEKETNVPVVAVPNTKQSDVTEPVRTAQNNTTKTQLSVKWEN